ncbi:MAG TPA: ankyrin repeat domain-containing protein [Coxiellaceae bacterium]|nr:ankyrin repeat domain-containing protein [Coxiellaceae bacterium]
MSSEISIPVLVAATVPPAPEVVESKEQEDRSSYLARTAISHLSTPQIYIPPATELKPDQIKFNNMVEENKPIAEKETALLVWLKEHPDFNACYVDKDGYTPRFLCKKYQLHKISGYLMDAHKAQFVYLKNSRYQDYALREEEGLKLLQGIIERNDFKAFETAFKLWELKLWCSNRYVDCGEKLPDYDNLPLDVLAYMAKHGRQAMIEMVLKKDPTAIKENVPIDTGGRGFPSMLIEAARADHKDLVVYLLAQGVNRDYETLIGETALSVAQQNGREEIVALLNPPMLTASI